MTTALSTEEIARQITERFPDTVIEASDTAVLIKAESLPNVMAFLKETPGLDCNYLNHITAVDYFDHFEVIYQLTSLEHNHSLIVKTHCEGRDNLSLPSVTSLWRGADYQEREIYDLMGITFEGHPNMKRIVLWPGFPGHPQRKDYL